MDVEGFIARWSDAPISERANCHSFIIQLCAVIGVEAPGQVTVGDRDYCFERAVNFSSRDGVDRGGFIDCYKRGSFVMEVKQSRKRAPGGALDARQLMALLNGRGRSPPREGAAAIESLVMGARRQAENYAEALPRFPPFLIVVDVGKAMYLWADFDRAGDGYVPFPDMARCRIDLSDLRDPAVRERLKRVWDDPLSLDPARAVTEVTSEVATLLGKLVSSIRERVLQDPSLTLQPITDRRIIMFVMQCIFAMFADSVGLIRDRGFHKLLQSYQGKADRFHLGAVEVFKHLAFGGHCAALRQDVPRLGGGLFREEAAIPLTEEELNVLIVAAKCDWASVEPATFGTMLEQALDPADRAELGAYFTPKAYVQRLVKATIIDSLRTDWEALVGSSVGDFASGNADKARKAVRKFHKDLCSIRVLDPACGTGNFLYVAMSMIKDLEIEVLGTLRELGDRAYVDGRVPRVGPNQFWGIEKCDHAASIAEMVMWIGYLQWQIRNGVAQSDLERTGTSKQDRILRADALLVSEAKDFHRDAQGRPISRIRADKEEQAVRYYAPKPAQWPPAHYIIGNPPFIGGKDLRRELGDGYVDALWHIRQGRFRSADLVMLWWDRAAEILTARNSVLRRFGFITTNSITQTFSRRVLDHHMVSGPPMRLVFAIPDHPWRNGADGTDVRIAMTVAERGMPDGRGRLLTITEEGADPSGAQAILFQEQRGVIGPDLTIGGALTVARPLKANALLCSPGVKLHGAGFIVSSDRSDALVAGSTGHHPIRAYRSGRDLAARPRAAKVIDLHGYTEADERRRWPRIVEHLNDTVKVERDKNTRATYRENWWIFGEPRATFRNALKGLPGYIATVEKSKHRWFRFLDTEVLPDNTVVAVASDDPRVLGVLSSRPHELWALARGGRLEDRPVYNKKVCFDAFPFPPLGGAAGIEIGEIAEAIESLRNQILSDDCTLTMTELYNQRLIAAAKGGHQSTAIADLDQLHRRMDAAVHLAYGWPSDMKKEAVIRALTDLNQVQSDQEAIGNVRFLRPEYQRDRVKVSWCPRQIKAPLVHAPTSKPMPETPEGLAGALLAELKREGAPMPPDELARRFDGKVGRRETDRVEQMLAVLAVAGSVQRAGEGWFLPRRH